MTQKVLEEKGAKRRSQRSYDAIMAAAEAEILECGYHAVTIEKIAARAGVGKMTIYRWWSGKPELFLEVYRRLTDAHDLIMETDAPLEDLRHFLAGLFALYRQSAAGRILAGLISEIEHSAEVGELLRVSLQDARRDLLLEPLKRAQGQGLIPEDRDLFWYCDTITSHVWQNLMLHPTQIDPAFADYLLANLFPDYRPLGPQGGAYAF